MYINRWIAGLVGRPLHVHSCLWVGLVLRPLLCEELWGVFAEDSRQQGPHYHRYKSTQIHKQALKS